MKILLLVGIGGFLGSIARYLTQMGMGRVMPVIFPYGTLTVNIVGSFLIGIIYGMMDRNTLLSAEWRIFLATGFCGGFTTFSTFSYETLTLFREGEYAFAGLYVGGSVVIGLVAVMAGIALIRML